MWTYQQSTGKLTSPGGSSCGNGYSGKGEGLNNSAMEQVENIGPIPQGRYYIGVFFFDEEKGPMVARLTPDGTTEMFGRDGFMIHGDNPQMDFSASEGCIIIGRPIREAIARSIDKMLVVTA